jgi:hypothetical protein
MERQLLLMLEVVVAAALGIPLCMTMIASIINDVNDDTRTVWRRGYSSNEDRIHVEEMEAVEQCRRCLGIVGRSGGPAFLEYVGVASYHQNTQRRTRVHTRLL